jgi:hypothetical protein
MNKSNQAQAQNPMSFLPMWKSILTMLATFGVVIAVHSLVAVGWMKPSGMALSLLAHLIMTRNILQVAVDPYPPANLILLLMRFGLGGPHFTLDYGTLE